MNDIRQSKLLKTVIALALAPVLGSAAEVEVNFTDPESFTDVGDGFGFDQRTFDRFRNAIEEQLQKAADRHLPEDARLEVEFRNVDLAGEVEPWRVNAQDVRIIREIYPPSMKFHFRVADGSGETLKEGLAQITDQTFTWNVGRSMHREESFFYEKELIDDWARRALRNLEATESAES